MKKSYVSLSLAIIMSASLLFAGCGSKDASPAEGAKSAEAGETVEGEAEAQNPEGDESPDQAGEAEGEDAPDASHDVTIEVENYGTIKGVLMESEAPETVKNFEKLANSGFYDGLTFHRIMSGFMIQGGDPLGDGSGGSDENIKGEFYMNGVENRLPHVRGAISMARSQDPDSASSQFFIVHQDSNFLDGQYACFGYVTEGMEVVDKICEDAHPTDDNGTIPPEEQPVIKSIKVEKR